MNLVAGPIAPNTFLHSLLESDGGVTCPLFAATFRDEEEDRTCFLKIDGQRITIKPVD